MGLSFQAHKTSSPGFWSCCMCLCPLASKPHTPCSVVASRESADSFLRDAWMMEGVSWWGPEPEKECASACPGVTCVIKVQLLPWSQNGFPVLLPVFLAWGGNSWQGQGSCCCRACCSFCLYTLYFCCTARTRSASSFSRITRKFCSSGMENACHCGGRSEKEVMLGE